MNKLIFFGILLFNIAGLCIITFEGCNYETENHNSNYDFVIDRTCNKIITFKHCPDGSKVPLKKICPIKSKELKGK